MTASLSNNGKGTLEYFHGCNFSDFEHLLTTCKTKPIT
jgi:hypothetical protein